MKRHIIHILILAAACVCLNGCKDFLGEIPKGEKIPMTIEDYRALVTATGSGENWAKVYISQEFQSESYTYGLDMTAGTNFLWLDDGSGVSRIEYTATSDIYNSHYSAIFRSNLVINEVPKIATRTEEEAAEAKVLVAQARVHRAYCYFHLVNTFAKAYNPATAETDNGVPWIDTADDFEMHIPQYTVAQIYGKIIDDLDQAIPDLPSFDELFDYQKPPKEAGYALRARVHQFMHNHDLAFADANSALALRSDIFDFVAYHKTNVIDRWGADVDIQHFPSELGTWSAPFSGTNMPMWVREPEGRKQLLYYASGREITNRRITADDNPANVNCVTGPAMFEEGDTRWLCNFCWFASENRYRHQRWDQNIHGSIKTTEMHYIRAEYYARKGDAANLQKAMDELNIVRKKRIIASKYTDLTASTKLEAINHIRRDRRVEMMASDMYFYDWKRFNTESEFALTRSRVDEDGITRTIAPDSELWVLPFPFSVTSKNKSLVQNTTI